MVVEQSFGMKKKKKKKRGRAGPARVFECRLDWLHFIHRCCDADRVFFPLLAEAFWSISVGWSARAQCPTCTQSVAFVAGDDLLARILFRSVLPLFSHFLSLSLSLSLFLYLYLLLTAVISSLLCTRRSFKRANEQDQSEFLRAPRINSFCRAVWPFFVYFAAFIILLSSSAAFLHWLRSSLRRSNVTLRMYLSFAHANFIAFSTSSMYSPFPRRT